MRKETIELVTEIISPHQKTQDELAEQFELTAKQLRNYKKLAESSPEIQDMLENGVIKPTVALKIISNMSETEQEEFFKQNNISKKITQKQVEQYLEIERKKFNKEKQELQNRLEIEINKKQEVKVVDNTEYETIEKLKIDLESKTGFYNKMVEKQKTHEQLMQMYQHDSEEYKKLKREMELITKQKNDLSRSLNSATELSGLIFGIERFMKEHLSPIKYSRAMIDVSDNDIVQRNLRDIVQVVQNWCDEMNTYLVNKNDEIINVKYEEEF